MVLDKNNKCNNCWNLTGYNPKSITTEYRMGCKKHYRRFWDMVEGITEECPFYNPYQLSFEDIKN